MRLAAVPERVVTRDDGNVQIKQHRWLSILTSTSLSPTSAMDLTTEEGVSHYLASSQWPSTRVQRLSGGSGNFSFRATLVTPFNGASTVVVKHAKNYAAFSRDFPFAVERQVRVEFSSSKLWMLFSCSTVTVALRSRSPPLRAHRPQR